MGAGASSDKKEVKQTKTISQLKEKVKEKKQQVQEETTHRSRGGSVSEADGGEQPSANEVTEVVPLSPTSSTTSSSDKKGTTEFIDKHDLKTSVAKMKSVNALNPTSERNRGGLANDEEAQNNDNMRHDDEDAAWEREKQQQGGGGGLADTNSNKSNSNSNNSTMNRMNSTNGSNSNNNNTNNTQDGGDTDGGNTNKPPELGGSITGGNSSSNNLGGTTSGGGGGQPSKKKKLLNGTNIEYRYPSGSVYVGAFRDGKLNGYGKYNYHPSGDSYEGEWQQDMKHGNGTYTYDCGDSYVGDWRLGKKHGKGEYHFMSGDRYVGGWREDKIHGYGIFHIAKNGNRFEGQWVDSYRHGNGTLFCGNGDVYEGNWTKGKEHGRGVLTYSNGNIYCGDWKQGQMDGKGIMVEDGQKQVVEHIAGYCIARTAVHDTAAVDPDWNPANEFYIQHIEKMKQKEKLGIAGEDGPTSEAVKEKITRLEESNANWERKYKQVLQQKAAEGDSLVEGDDAALDTLSNSELKAKIKEYKTQLQFERTRAEEHEKAEKKLEAELSELKFDAKEVEGLKKEVEYLKATSSNGQGGGKMVPMEERDRLQRRIVELERDIMPALQSDPALSDNKKNGGKSDADMKAQLQIMESEVKTAKAQKGELQKLRQENMDFMQRIQRVEQQAAEATKEAQHQRLRNQSMETEISGAQQQARVESGGELKDLRQENVDLKTGLIVSEETIQKFKRRMADFDDMSKRNQVLEVELQQMQSNRAAVADKTDNKLDQLRLQNAEQARKLEEADMSIAPVPTIDLAGVGGGSAEMQSKIAEFEAQHKKDKKKAKKIQNERDDYFAKLNGQMMVSRLHANDAAVSSTGKVLVYARKPSTGSTFNTFTVSPDGTSILLRDGDKPLLVDGVIPADDNMAVPSASSAGLLASIGGLKGVVGAVGTGQNVHLMSLGPMHSGKTSWMKQKLSPLVFEELFQSLDKISGTDLKTSVYTQCVELTAGGIVDINNKGGGDEPVEFLRNSHGVTEAVNAKKEGPWGSARDLINNFESAISSGRTKARSHVIFSVLVTLQHKVNDMTFTGRLTLADLAGPGALGDQGNDIDSAKYVNKSIVSMNKCVDALAGGANRSTPPYTDDPLTTALSDAIGGNSKVIVFVSLGGESGAAARGGETAAEMVESASQALATAQKMSNIQNRPVQHFTSTEELRLREIVSTQLGPEEAAPKHKEIDNLVW